MTKLGKIYITPGGAQLIVTKGGSGALTDGNIPLLLKDSGETFSEGAKAGAQVGVKSRETLQIGRW